MQLVKQRETLDYVWKDVTFKVRAKATTRDKHNMVEALAEITDIEEKTGTKATNKIVKVAPRIIESFVTDWEGVVDGDGKAVPWSMESFYALPSDPDSNLVALLGSFILTRTGLVESKEDDGKKKE